METPLTASASPVVPASHASVEGEDGAPAKSPMALQDMQTLSQLRRGNWGAMEQLVARYQDRLYATVYRLVSQPEDAADLVQETFVRAMQNISRFEGKSSLYTWLFRIAVNLSLSHRRSMRYRSAMSLEGDDSDHQADGLRGALAQHTEMDPADEASMRMDHHRLLEAIHTLPAEFRAVIILRDVENCDYEQMAEVLEVPLGTLKSRLFRARAALREALQEKEKTHLSR